MDEDIPDRGDIAVFDVDSAEKEGNAQGEGVKFENEWKNPEPREAGRNAVDESENNDDAEVNAKVDKGGGGGGNNYNPLWEADFAQKVAARDDCVDSLAGTFGEKVPEDGAG